MAQRLFRTQQVQEDTGPGLDYIEALHEVCASVSMAGEEMMEAEEIHQIAVGMSSEDAKGRINLQLISRLLDAYRPGDDSSGSSSVLTESSSDDASTSSSESEQSSPGGVTSE